ncbi:MAG: restriction endonuclease subunit S, partial [Bacilli bacterium]|nr:restriction endonuclease subunit S [Bacilli bacterium]
PLCVGTTITHMYGKDLSNLFYSFPEIKEQEKIGSFFKELDNLITLHQRKLNKLEDLKQAYLEKIFPKNKEVIPEYRFKGFTNNWEQRKLGDIYDFTKGKGLPLDSFVEGNHEPSIAYGHLYTKYSEVITEVNLSSDDEGTLSKINDLLFPGSSTVPYGTAQSNAIMLDNVKLGGDVIIAREKKQSSTNAPFVSYQINSNKKKLYPLCVGTTITHMYGKDLSNLFYSFPEIKEQEKIGSFFNELDNLITVHQRKLDKLKNLKQAYLNEMFVN